MHRLTEISLRWPKMTLVVAVVLAALGALSAARAPTSVGARAMFEPGHPAITELEEFTAQFAGGRPVIVAWSCEGPPDPCESVFDQKSLLMAGRVGGELLGFPEIARVSSPAHSSLLVTHGDELIAHRFVEDGVVDAPPELVAQALDDPLWRQGLISADGRVGALVVESSSSETSTHERMISEIEASIAPFEREGFRFALSGHPWIDVAAFRGMSSDGAFLGAATIAVIVVCLLALIQSWQSVLAVLATIGFATGTALIVVGIFSWPWDPITSAAPTLVLVLGSADAVHFLSSYWRSRAGKKERHDALLIAARETGAPCAMTTATSVAGLASFLTTDAVAIAHFGGVAAGGVLACLAFTFSALPALIKLLPDAPRFALRESRRWDGIIERLIEYPIRHRYIVLASALAATVVGSWGLTRLTTHADLVGYWKSGDPTREGIEFVSERLSSLDSVEIQVSTPLPLEDGGPLRALQLLERDLREVEHVTEVRSVLAILERVAVSLGAPAVDRGNVGELLSILAMGDPSAVDGWISLDHQSVRVSVSVGILGSGDRERLLGEIAIACRRLPQGFEAAVTGPSALQFHTEKLLADAAVQSVSASSLLVTLLVMGFLRSVRWGALAMIPNLVPMVVMFGTMGILGIALDAGAAVVAPIAIGVAVDDTMHFLHSYSGFRRTQTPPLGAVRLAAFRVGRAMVTTSGTLALGFLAMLASRFQSASNIGTLSAIAIASAFAAELLVLPALIAAFSDRLDSARSENQEVTS